jgi:hypothetical protein
MFTGTFDTRFAEDEDYPEGLPPIPIIQAAADPMVEYIPRGLAVEIGESECRMLLRIAWQIFTSGHYRHGNWWTYQTIDDLHAFFPAWGRSTAGRAAKNLVERRLLLATSKFNKRKNDTTLWYALNIEEIGKLQTASVVFADPKSKKHPKRQLVESSRGPDESQIGMDESQIGMTESHSGTTLPESSSESSPDLRIEEDHFRGKRETGPLLKQLLEPLAIKEKVLREIDGKLTEADINAAKYVTLAKASTNPAGYFAEVIREWARSEDSKQHGLEMARDVWFCGECEVFNHFSSVCRKCGRVREHLANWCWAIPRDETA